jgi:hypothetical protein
MAKKKDTGSASWLLLDELRERSDPAFVDELRRSSDADRLGALAARWYGDQRPESRRLLLEYLRRPLNSFRHEALVKRLFKLAESTGDDEAMAHFLTALDRSVRRKVFRHRRSVQRGKKWDTWEEEWLKAPPRTTMPRDAGQRSRMKDGEENCWLFSVHTRNYLRRRAWRYFRRLGRQHPERYIPAVLAALKLYTDADVSTGVQLIDNWGLMHILFHGCPALLAQPNGWTIAEGHSLGELAPAPAYEELWKAAPKALLELLREAPCRPVRQWTIRLLQRDHGAVLASLTLDELLALLGHADEDVVALAAGVIRDRPGLDTLPVDRWLSLLDTPNVAALEVLCELIGKHVKAERVTLDEAVRLTSSRPLPIGRLGLSLIQAKTPASEPECRALLGLVEAQCEPLRAEIVRWARGVLSASAHYQNDWVLEYLDSRHADVRGEGWAWFQAEPRARESVDIWRKLLESPYDDVRLPLLAALEERVRKGDATLTDDGKLDPELVRQLWATVLLNVHRGSRLKAMALGQLVRRVERRPAEAPQLLPIVSVALRSVRGPEWRAGLTGVVQMIERRPELAPAVRAAFPELKWES